MWLSFPLQALCLLKAARDCCLQGWSSVTLQDNYFRGREAAGPPAPCGLMSGSDKTAPSQPGIDLKSWAYSHDPEPGWSASCSVLFHFWSCALLSRQRSCEKQRKKRTSQHEVPVACWKVSVQSLSRIRLLATPWIAGHQAASPIGPSPIPGVCSNSCPFSRWYHPTISSSVTPLSSCLQSFPASQSFPIRQFFVSGGWSIGTSAWASILPMIIQDWFPIEWTGLTSLQSKTKDKNLCTFSSPVIPDFCLFLILSASPRFSSPCFFLQVLCETHGCVTCSHSCGCVHARSL